MNIVSKRAGEILEKLGYSKERVELAKIAGYMHDIGNCVNKINHAHLGAFLTYNILKDLDMSAENRIEIMNAICVHNEKKYLALTDISSALILADISDVRDSRVKNKNISTFDIHDKLNYAVSSIELIIDEVKRKARLELTIDTKLFSILEWFEMFITKALLSKCAAEYLNISFELIINDTKLL